MFDLIITILNTYALKKDFLNILIFHSLLYDLPFIFFKQEILTLGLELFKCFSIVLKITSMTSWV